MGCSSYDCCNVVRCGTYVSTATRAAKHASSGGQWGKPESSRYTLWWWRSWSQTAGDGPGGGGWGVGGWGGGGGGGVGGGGGGGVGGGTRPENWWGCAAGRWKLDPKRSRKKLNLGPKRSIFVKIGSFCTPKDSFAVGGWEKYPKKIVLDPAKVKKGGQNRGTYVSPIT